MELPPLLAVSVLPLLDMEGESFPITGLLFASVGITRQDTTKMMVGCNINVEIKNYKVWANYVYSPVKFLYGGSMCPIGSFYIKALIHPR